jgi:exopolysaccharide/PEP-CTERM locus tyrosine autokinase
VSIVERAADFLGKLSEPKPISTTEGLQENFDESGHGLIERIVDRENLKPAAGVTQRFPRAGPKIRERELALEGSKVAATTLNIDVDLLRRQYMTTPDGERTMVSECFRRIKRHILANVTSPDRPARANLIMITSSVPKEGKTFCTINLAISLAMEMDRRVLLVDADVLRPSVSAALGIKSVEKGLMDVLLDGINLADVLCNTNIEKLSLLPAGRRHAHSSELLASDAMRDMLKEMAERYSDRIVIFDSPPLLATTESRVLAGLMGQVILVVEAERTAESTLKAALAHIDTNNVVGVVLNKGAPPVSALYGGYGYGDGGHKV